MQEMGYTDVTPNNVCDQDEYDVNMALMVHQITNSQPYKNAQEKANKRDNPSSASKGGGGATAGKRGGTSKKGGRARGRGSARMAQHHNPDSAM